MKKFLQIENTSPELERSKESATKLNHKLPTEIRVENGPLMELSFLAKYIHAKRQKHHKILILICENF